MGIMYLALREEMRFRRLAELEQERSAMLAVISHRLRTPLTSLKWYTEILQETGKLTKEQMEMVKNIERGSAESNSLLNRFLEVSRRTSGTISQTPSIVNAREAIQTTIDSLGGRIKEKNIVLTFIKSDREKESPLVYIDPHILQDILDAIISNAVSYTPDRGWIDINIIEQREHMVVKVLDTGVGISKSEQARIFLRFFRGAQAKLISPQGNGLGLFLAKRLIEEANGSMWFESEEGKGSTFFVKIPKAR
jgi:signal transduction histidine kinase